jgi:hypothetical protein
MTIAVFGANGATGRLLVSQALDVGHEVVAVRRNPDSFPFHRSGLRIVKADVHEAAPVSRSIAGCEAVLSTLGVNFTRDPITVYSEGAKNIIAGMHERGIARLVVVSSSATYPHYHCRRWFSPEPRDAAARDCNDWANHLRGYASHGGVGSRKRSRLDNRAPSGLFDLTEVTDYRVDENEAPGVFTSRIDLAACMLAQLYDERFVRKNLAVTTTSVRPSMLQMILKEAFKKS